MNDITSDQVLEQLSTAEAPTLQGPWDYDKLVSWYNYLVDDRVYMDTLESRRFIAFDKWKNELILPNALNEMLPHFFASWARNLIAGTLLYHGVGAIWCFWM